MSRILTLQRQARELGRLRAGVYELNDKGKMAPRRSDTWIVTSHSHEYVAAAAEEWGGIAEQWTPNGSSVSQWRVVTESATLDAILPPGDPLKQYYEKWNKGGCERRCDGETESLDDQPCVCRARFGEAFHERKPDEVCQATSRLNVILPQMPDIGTWRMESHSYYAAVELAAHIDLIRQAVSEQYAVPIRIRLEKRDRMVRGKARHYTVPVVELRGVVAGEVLAGAIPPAITQEPRPAIEAAPPAAVEAGMPEGLTATKILALAALCKNPQQINHLWEDAKGAGILTDELKTQLRQRGEELGGKAKDATDAKGATDTALDILWSQIVAASPFDTTKELEADFWQATGKDPQSATTEDLRNYLKERGQ